MLIKNQILFTRHGPIPMTIPFFGGAGLEYPRGSGEPLGTMTTLMF